MGNSKSQSGRKVKVKTKEVSSRSFLGRKSEMDKVIEQWIHDGWEVVDKQPIGDQKYLLTFEFELPPHEPRKSGCLQISTTTGYVIVFVLILVFIGSALQSGSKGIETGTPFKASTADIRVSPTQRSSRTITPNPRVNTVTPIKVVSAAIGAAPTETIFPISKTASKLGTVTPQLISSAVPTDMPSATSTKPATIEPTTTLTSTITDTPYPTITPQPQVFVSSNQNVNLRAGASTGTAIITSLPPQTPVLVLGQNDAGDWLHIRTTNGTEGWILASLINVQAVPATARPSVQSQPTVIANLSTIAPSAVACIPNLQFLPGLNSGNRVYEDLQYHYRTYSYYFDDDKRYEVELDVAGSWIWIVQPIARAASTLDQVGTTIVNGVTVHYGYDGELGWYQGIEFDFEYGTQKFSGDVTLFDDLSDERDRPQLLNRLRAFIGKIVRC